MTIWETGKGVSEGAKTEPHNFASVMVADDLPCIQMRLLPWGCKVVYMEDKIRNCQLQVTIFNIRLYDTFIMHRRATNYIPLV